VIWKKFKTLETLLTSGNRQRSRGNWLYRSSRRCSKKRLLSRKKFTRFRQRPKISNTTNRALWQPRRRKRKRRRSWRVKQWRTKRL
jgi:hypothetical protein